MINQRFFFTCLMASLTLGGCSSKGRPAGAPPRPDRPPSARSPKPADQEELQRARREMEQLRVQLKAKEAELASLEERYAALEVELASVLEEVLRSKASLRTVQTRAVPISRIAEVRVQLSAVPRARDPEVASRLERAQALLSRADAALEEGNFGGASYLADRAGEVVRQARAAAELRSAAAGQADAVIPIVPPRTLQVAANAPLRAGPGTDRPSIAQASKGEKLKAVARSGEWYQVETGGQRQAWIHRSAVR